MISRTIAKAVNPSEMPDIPDFLRRTKEVAAPKPFIGTYTIINDLATCPHKMYRRYIKKDTPFVPTREADWGNEVHTAFEHRIQGGKPLPPLMEKWEGFAKPFDGLGAVCEMQLAMTSTGHAAKFFNDTTAWFRGKADTVVMASANAYLADWKTGKSREDPLELEVQALLLKVRYPDIATVKGAYVWLKEDRMGQQHDLSDFNATWKTVQTRMAEIKDRTETEDWEKTPGPLCGWCDVTDCQYNKKAERIANGR